MRSAHARGVLRPRIGAHENRRNCPKKILVKGQAPSHLEPHVHAILDDAPASLLASVADQVHQETGLDRKDVWSNYKRLAEQVKSKRDLWK